MLELKNIKKSYKVGDTKQEVLKGIEIKFRKNEFTSILGTSGSGKTTLLNIIGGLDKYDSGDLIIEGISTKNYTDRDWDAYRNYRVGFIFQSYNLIMHQSVFSNVEISLTLSGVSKSERKKRVEEALEKVGLKDHIYKKPSQLSGGQMQRVAIARALVNNPEIILADEPTGALDSNTSVQIMELLKEIAKDKLIIMVTHNPELAKEYSSRIIELKDGKVISDNSPYDGKDDKESNVKNEETRKTSMSLLTSLSLSFNNLLTKKGRTFLTAFAGSIGIIGIALILSLSNGVSKMVSDMEKDSLSDFPITIEKNNFDLFGSLSSILDEASLLESTKEDGKLHSKDDLVSSKISTEQSITKKNNLKEFKKFVEKSDIIKENSDNILYGYDIQLQIYNNNYEKVNPSEIIKSASNELFKELENRDSVLKTKYTILAGNLPQNSNEVVLVLNSKNTISDSVLYGLGIKDKKDLLKDLAEYEKNDEYKVTSTAYEYTDFIGKSYKLLLNTDYYEEENGIFIDYSNDLEYLKQKIDNATELKIVGVVQSDSETSAYIGYTHDLTLKVINEISKTSIYQKQMENPSINILTNTEFDSTFNTYDDLAKKLGIYNEDDPSTISIYPKNFDGKEAIVNEIEKYNQEKKDSNEKNLVISYTDMMKSLVNGVTGVVNIVSYVLIGFVAISLIVSSIMIAIITYISVLERTKEIGILRAIGASKRDIKRVFVAETIIEGTVAGVLGIIITLILSMPINLIVGMLAKIQSIASLPFLSAILLILLSILLNVIAGSKPSSMAAKKDPVEALRNE
ncbi:MAG: ABC transporter ATP-binding protein/permease [Clostridia bacterium]|nr:ABC transporter ATP-binding protein/permease [Clostridia bacterium]